MRALLQRVSRASVTTNEEVIGQIDQGLLVFLGIGHSDNERTVQWMVDKVLGLRIFEDAEGKMNRSVVDISGAVLAISQFTLYADTQKGKRPSFIDAAKPEPAELLYRAWCTRARATGVPVQMGRFGADMKVSLVNDGPVTIWLDSDQP